MREKRRTLDKKEENLKLKKIAKKQKLQDRGITLIALVVTIVILLILAGVTLNIALSDGGLFSKTKEAAKKYQIEADREALEMSIMSYKLGENTDDGSPKLGKELLDKSLDSTWNVIVSNDKTYGTGWYYIEKGKEIEGLGKAKNAFVINYETGEVVELEDNNYVSLSAGDMLAVKEDLIINVDSSIIDKGVKNDKESLQKQFGDGVELVGFDFDGDNGNSGLTNTSFNFDGVDDYIKVKYNSQEQKEALAKNGFTFEFYGTWNDGTSYDDKGNNLAGSENSELNSYRGLFCYWGGEDTFGAQLRFGVTNRNPSILWNAGAENSLSDYCDITAPWNISYKIDLEELKKGAYITVTVDTTEFYEKNDGNGNEQYYKQTMYLNGEKKYEGGYNKKQWDAFINTYLEDLKFFCIGRSSMHKHGYWHYSKMNAYCLRLYSKALSEEEVLKNYDKSVKYHSLLAQ